MPCRRLACKMFYRSRLTTGIAMCNWRQVAWGRELEGNSEPFIARSIKESCRIMHVLAILRTLLWDLFFPIKQNLSNNMSNRQIFQLVVSSLFLRLQCCHLMDMSLRKIRLGLESKSVLYAHVCYFIQLYTFVYSILDGSCSHLFTFVHICSLDVGFVEFDQVEAMAHDVWKRVSHYGKAPKRGGEVAPRLTQIDQNLASLVDSLCARIVELMSPLSRRSAAFAYRMHFSRLKDRNIRNKLNTLVLFDSFAMQLSLLRSSLVPWWKETVQPWPSMSGLRLGQSCPGILQNQKGGDAVVENHTDRSSSFLHYNDLGFPGFAFLRISLELAAGEAPPAAGRDGGTGGPRLMAKRCFVMLRRPERVWICTYLYIPGLVAL